MLAVAAYSAINPFEFLLNGKSFSGDIALPYSLLPAVTPEEDDLLRHPTTNDVFGYVANGQTVTCHIVKGTLLTCSNGLEMDVNTQTVQQVFQLLAETHTLLHTPQEPPEPSVREEIMPTQLETKKSFDVLLDETEQ